MPHFQLYVCLRLTSPNYAFIRRRLYSKRKVKEYLGVGQFLTFSRMTHIQTASIQMRRRVFAAKRGVSSGSALFANINTLLVIIKFVYDQALIHFGLIHVVIGDKSVKGAFVITNSVKLGVREINIGSTHTFYTHSIKIPSEL